MPYSVSTKEPNIYQDRLGTNTGKALKKERRPPVFANVQGEDRMPNERTGPWAEKASDGADADVRCEKRLRFLLRLLRLPAPPPAACWPAIRLSASQHVCSAHVTVAVRTRRRILRQATEAAACCRLLPAL